MGQLLGDHPGPTLSGNREIREVRKWVHEFFGYPGGMRGTNHQLYRKYPIYG
jgi:hypothetical protein